MPQQPHQAESGLVEYYLGRLALIHKALYEQGISIKSLFLENLPVKPEWFFPGGKRPENFPAAYSEPEHLAAIREAALIHFAVVDAMGITERLTSADGPGKEKIAPVEMLDLARHAQAVMPGSRNIVYAASKNYLKENMKDWSGYGTGKQNEIADFLTEIRQRTSRIILGSISARYRRGENIFVENALDPASFIHGVDTALLSGKTYRIDLKLDETNTPVSLQSDYVTPQGDWRRMAYEFKKGEKEGEMYYTRSEYILAGRNDSSPKRIMREENKLLTQEIIETIKATAPGLSLEQPALDRGAEIWVNGRLQASQIGGTLSPAVIIHGLLDLLIPTKIENKQRDGSVIDSRVFDEAVTALAFDTKMTPLSRKDMGNPAGSSRSV